jgi:protein prenyltransferase alpha subunit repeat containing protein 1
LGITGRFSFAPVRNGRDPRSPALRADPGQAVRNCFISIRLRLTYVRSTSIEILPASWSSSSDNPHEPFEFADRNLGIPKQVFYQIYGEVIRQFEKFLVLGIAAVEKEGLNDLLEITCIIVLVNPAHATCLNRRKELVERGALNERDELKVTAALQLRPEGAKSSILWHHRRWLLRRLYQTHSQQGDTSVNMDTLDDCTIALDGLAEELSVATTASRIYPRNYHAWLHRYKCLQSMIVNYGNASNALPSQLTREALAQMLRAEEFAVSKWIEVNVSDYSAQHYICHVYRAMEERRIEHIQVHSEGELDSTAPINPESNKLPFSPLNHAEGLVERYPTHEALWYYLRTAYAAQPKGSKRLHPVEGRQGAYADNFRRWRGGFECREMAWAAVPEAF